MPSDWSDPERAERELARREGRAPSGTGPQEDSLAEILPAMRRLLERLEAETASQTEDIAALAAMLARIDARLAAGEEPPPQVPQETASGAEIAEAEGRITAHVDRLAGHIEPTARAMPEIWKMAETAAAAPGEIGKLRETVEGLAKGQHELSGKTSDHTLGLIGFQGKLAHKLDEATTAMAGHFSEEAGSIREAMERTAATVLERRRLSRRLRWIVAGALLFLVLACTAAGIWLQWEFALAPPKTETGGG
ncbi:MAG: hypothetical protein OXG99_14805 [Alphaproteobacteria bacterium]|nr:hypothetical protein [Alphaproteobacteria bacterium]